MNKTPNGSDGASEPTVQVHDMKQIIQYQMEPPHEDSQEEMMMDMLMNELTKVHEKNTQTVPQMLVGRDVKVQVDLIQKVTGPVQASVSTQTLPSTDQEVVLRQPIQLESLDDHQYRSVIHSLVKHLLQHYSFEYVLNNVVGKGSQKRDLICEIMNRDKGQSKPATPITRLDVHQKPSYKPETKDKPLVFNNKFKAETKI